MSRWWPSIVVLAGCAAAPPRPDAPSFVRTGDLHDFDMFAGDWKLDNRRLRARGVGSNDWEEFPATSRTAIHLGGVSNVDEIVFPTKGWSGLTVRVFHRETRQWSIYWVNSRVGVMFPPVVGGFTGDRGEFYGDDEDDGRRVKVRFVWTKLGHDAARWEQSFSYDGGRTWELNWVNTLTRTDSTGPRDFDALVGAWKTHHRRLKERLAGSHEWVEFGGTFELRLLMGGFANVDDSVFDAPGGAYRGVGLSAYDAKTGEWAQWGLDGRNPFGELDPPIKGRFENGVGTFYADDTLRGKKIRVRVTWSNITPTSAHWEQAFSPDGGKTWETNWITDFQRVQGSAAR
ncbi:MAG TPA: hypothetical protein VKE22_11085 [Haliangiales bacterium]|nr:hypothetical protein [Haliangiales bacterium]